MQSSSLLLFNVHHVVHLSRWKENSLEMMPKREDDDGCGQDHDNNYGDNNYDLAVLLQPNIFSSLLFIANCPEGHQDPYYLTRN